MTERLAYTVAEAARSIGVSERYIWSLIKIGKLRSLKLGRRRLIPCSWFEEDLISGQ